VSRPPRLVGRSPALDAAGLLAPFTPPPRFAGVRFSMYRSDAAHPSQALALAMEAFAAEAASS
jgi:cell division protein ZapE